MVVSDIQEAAATYALLGFELKATPIVDKVQKATIAFVQVAEGVSVELLEPKGADSPIHRFLQRSEGGVHHLCYEVDNVGQWWRKLRNQGAVPVGQPVPAVALENRLIAFMYLKGSLIELLEAHHDT